ncbi:MAG: cystathionine gamma-synthase [Planctomycetes bacterium]|nr:cystathionine gamma-synthase [Planctomycetota bacterium]
MKPRNDSTVAARSGVCADTQHGAVMPPLHLSANFSFESFGKKRAYDYTRSGNPTRDLFAAALAELEHGSGAVVTSTGMSAVALVLELLEPGARVLAPHDGYGGTWRLLRARERQRRIEVELVDMRDAAALAAALARRPALVWIETPSNPLLRITDVRSVAAAAHAAGALVACDNTFLSPVLQKPLDLGADLVVHSTTKYINGHSDVVGGAVVARNPELVQQLAWWANCTGITGAPFDSYLALRGLRTLPLRMRAQQQSAGELATALEGHAGVREVHYPGLGAMLSFEVEGGAAAVERFLAPLEHFTLAESLGGVESLVAHPATMTHASMDEAARATAGITPGLVRLSIGIEDARDLWLDLERGLSAAAASDPRSRGTSFPGRRCSAGTSPHPV